MFTGSVINRDLQRYCRHTHLVVTLTCFAKVCQKLNSRHTTHVWSETVQKYSRCDLTFCSDRLIAISALARRTCASLKLSPKDYLAGLWRPELDYELLWYTPSKIYDQEETISSCQVWDSDQVGAPSWSWASCNFHVLLPVRDPRNELVNCLVVLEAETVFGNDPFGSLSGGRLLVQPPLHHIEHSKKPTGTLPEEPFFPGHGKSDSPLPIKIRWDHDWESTWDEKGYLKPKSLYCMCIQAGTGSFCGVCCLVLQPTGQGIGQFR
ncbi:hypothetical protein HYALB_00008562 [Hymenoscyphus albidus]|uniref:Heterokaryon incompatibility domain-containing protein n=1 Tax=Hymenoscyphus albidus TaxID=595503 RepID=A0A9N9LHT4_9HELO|nr:hypothetical protein HYALB_00008562 [Hymenoscyphus albidus]